MTGFNFRKHRLKTGAVIGHTAHAIIHKKCGIRETVFLCVLEQDHLSYPRTLFTKRQLIDDIWDLDSEVDEHTVEVYISRLREKFRDNGDFELRTIRGFGYMGMLREDEDAQS